MQCLFTLIWQNADSKEWTFHLICTCLSALPVCLKDAEWFISTRSGTIWFSCEHQSSLSLPHVSVKTILFTVYFFLSIWLFFLCFPLRLCFTCPGEKNQDLERERERNGEGEKDDNIVKERCWSREKPMDQAGGCCQGSTGEVLIRKDEPAVKRSSRMSSRRSLTFLCSLAAFPSAP